MTLRRLITLPLAMLVIVGLAFAPLVTPASAKMLGMMGGGMHLTSHADATSDQAANTDMHAMHHMDAVDSMSDMAAMHDMSAMSGTMSGMEPMAADMPCCPSDKKDNACPDCPLMAICTLKTAQAHPSMDGVLLVRTPVRTIQSAHDDALLSGLNHPPPDHPPRHLI